MQQKYFKWSKNKLYAHKDGNSSGNTVCRPSDHELERFQRIIKYIITSKKMLMREASAQKACETLLNINSNWKTCISKQRLCTTYHLLG